MIVLGIETSCDETAAAVVTGERAILADIVRSQTAAHAPFGGIVPEIAARAHLECLDTLIAEALRRAGVTLDDLDGIAATAGPGLIGGLIVGVMTGKAIAAARGLPFIAVNHLEGHALSARLVSDAAFPYLLLLVSGGHCQLLVAEGVGKYRRLGTTIDDAVGEAFDKAAKMLGLPYPGGPEIEKLAAGGNPSRFALPRPLLGSKDCHFSFSGLKTAMRRAIANLPQPLTKTDSADLAASFQAAVADVLVDRCGRAIEIFRDLYPAGDTLVVAGGVAANRALRNRLEALGLERGLRLVAPPQNLCTDNAAMIAWAGIERLRLKLSDGLDFAPRPRWPLDPAAPPAAGAGIKA